MNRDNRFCEPEITNGGTVYGIKPCRVQSVRITGSHYVAGLRETVDYACAGCGRRWRLYENYPLQVVALDKQLRETPL